MKKENIEQYLDLRKAETDPVLFAAALAVKHVRQLAIYGGSEWERPDDEDALHPQHLEVFLACAVQAAQETQRFEREWRDLQKIIPRIKEAWEKGRAYFRVDLARATTNQEEMEYLPQIHFAVDCYARVDAWNTYSDSSALQKWFINGYMVAWRLHFLSESTHESFPLE